MLTTEHIERITCIAKQIAPDGGLHNPSLTELEREYLGSCVDTGEVSSIGARVLQFEKMLEEFTGAKHAVPVVNGTAALTLALKVAGVKPGDFVITQPLTFIGTCNAIAACGAVPVFVDVDRETGGMDPIALENALKETNATAVVPVDVMGIPCDIRGIRVVASKYYIPVIEDAAEALGSFTNMMSGVSPKFEECGGMFYQGVHCGTLADAAILSFNGNKTITCGGGGAILTDNDEWAGRARHLSTQAKKPHRWEFEHDEVANNLRMPNVNAALGCAQMERIDEILREKRRNFDDYRAVLDDAHCDYMRPAGADTWNHWLVTLLAEDLGDRDRLLREFNDAGVKARPLWKPLNRFGPYRECVSMPTPNADWLYERVISLPSGVRP